MPVILGRDQEDHSSKSAQANSSQDPVSKMLNTKKAGRLAWVIDLLPRKHEALSPNPSIVKKKERKKIFLNILFAFYLGFLTTYEDDD
jgi:hypothetical protein